MVKILKDMKISILMENIENIEYVIYKLCSKDKNIQECYVGSTKNYDKRKTCHKTRCNNPLDKKHNFYVYKFIRENGGFENFEFIIIEKLFTADKLFVLKRERHWIEILNSKLNKQIPTQTDKEYREKFYNEIIERKKNYYIKNRTKIRLKQNEKFDCECGGKYTHNHRLRHLKTKKHQEFCMQI